MAKFKRVFASLDASIKDVERAYRRLYFNTLGMGYSPYHNHEDLAREFVLQSPWKNLGKTLLGERYCLLAVSNRVF